MKSKYKVFLLLIFLLATFSSDAQDATLWDASWSNDGKYIAVGGDDNTLRIYDGESFKLISRDTLDGEIYRLRWHPTENILAIVGELEVIQLLNIETRESIKLNPTAGSRAIAWNHDGQMIAIADYEGVLTIWSKQGTLLQTVYKERTMSYVAVDWHPCKNEIIALTGDVRIIDMKGQLLQRFKHRKEDVMLLCVEWHQSGNFFVIGDYGDNYKPYSSLLQFWNTKYELTKSDDIATAEYRNVNWSNDGDFLASASESLRIWSKDGKVLYEGKSAEKLWGIDWKSDGKYIVTSSENMTIKIWNSKAELVKELEL
ncbi:MAG: WD40 repeat domain-containing protein [Saprospiraceae bacterium]